MGLEKPQSTSGCLGHTRLPGTRFGIKRPNKTGTVVTKSASVGHFRGDEWMVRPVADVRSKLDGQCKWPSSSSRYDRGLFNRSPSPCGQPPDYFALPTEGSRLRHVVDTHLRGRPHFVAAVRPHQGFFQAPSVTLSVIFLPCRKMSRWTTSPTAY